MRAIKDNALTVWCGGVGMVFLGVLIYVFAQPAPTHVGPALKLYLMMTTTGLLSAGLLAAAVLLGPDALDKRMRLPLGSIIALWMAVMAYCAM